MASSRESKEVGYICFEQRFACRPGGALLYHLHLLHLLNTPCPGRGRVTAPSPKHGVRSPPCPYRPPGRTCALCARTARPPAPPLCVLCDLKTHWQSACASTPPVSVPLCLLCGLCVLRNLRFPSGSPSSCLFVVLRAPSCQPRRANLPHSPNAPSVARLPRALCSLFSVFCSLFSGAAPPPLTVRRGSRGVSWCAKGGGACAGLWPRFGGCARA